MKHIVAVTACPTGIAHTIMAAEALRQTARLMGHEILVETQGLGGVKGELTETDIASADVVVIGADTHVDLARFAGKPVYETSTSRAIRETRSVVEAALLAAGHAEPAAAPTAVAGKLLVAITACPTGIAHTFMAAEALKRAAAAAGHTIKVETQGSVGAKGTLSAADIAAADAVVIGADTHVDLARFTGKRVYQTTTKTALKEAPAVIAAALQLAAPTTGGAAPGAATAVAAPAEARVSPYKHLLTGVSFMLPIVVAGGLITALSFVFGIEAFKQEGSLAAALMSIGSGAAFKLMVPVLSGYIAFSIADRPGLAPGLIGGMLANNLQAGFLGGIVAGFIAGYVALWLRDNVKLPQHLEGLKPVLIIPLVATLVVGLVMVYVIGTPVRGVMDALTAYLKGMGSGNALLLGLLLGAMMAVDMGGPLNKAAYAFAVGLVSSGSFTPMAAVMAAGMTPPLGLAVATFVAKGRFTLAEREAGKATAVLGLAFITEGVIPFAAKDPLRVIPGCVAGSALAGGLSMYFGCALRAPHGGVFVLAIPGAITPVLPYAASIIAGTLVTALGVVVMKRPVAPDSALGRAQGPSAA